MKVSSSSILSELNFFYLSLTVTTLTHFMFILLSPQAIRVDKLHAEVMSYREKVEEATRLQLKVKDLKKRNEQVMESKAALEDEVDNLKGKIKVLDELKKDNATLKAQMDSITSVSYWVR